jgi:hypothetical protein
MEDTIETLFEYMIEDGALCRLLHVDESEIHNYRDGGGQDGRVVSLDFLGDGVYEVAVTIDEPLYMRTKCGQCGKVFPGNFSVVKNKILCRTCHPTEETKFVSDVSGSGYRRLEEAANALLQAAKLRGGGELFYEEFGRYCFCSACGFGEKGPYRKNQHATSCDDLNIAIHKAERLCIIFSYGDSLQLVLDPNLAYGLMGDTLLVSKDINGCVVTEMAMSAVSKGMIGDYKLTRKELRWLKDVVAKGFAWLVGQQEVINAQKGGVPCPMSVLSAV